MPAQSRDRMLFARLRIREYIINNPSCWDTDIDNFDTWQSGKTVDLDAHYAPLWRESYPHT